MIPTDTLPRDAVSPRLAPVLAELGIEQQPRHLEEHGYAVIEKAADPSLTTRMRSALIERGSSQMLLTADPVFCEAVLSPKLLALAEYSVGQGFMISQVAGSVREKGAESIGLHADQNWLPAPFPEHNYLITFCWVHDEFTQGGGATLVIPGSHRHRRHPSREEIAACDGAIAMEAPPNSAVVWDGSVWHSNFPRQIDGERVVTHITYSRLSMRPVENYQAHADELVAAHGPTMASLLGRDDMLDSPTGADYSKLAHTFTAAKT